MCEVFQIKKWPVKPVYALIKIGNSKNAMRIVVLSKKEYDFVENLCSVLELRSWECGKNNTQKTLEIEKIR